LLALLVAAGCHLQEEKLLPWFKVRTTRYSNIGGFSGSSQQESFVRSWGLWHKLDRCFFGEVLDARMVALHCSDQFNQGLALLRKGETVPRPACGSYKSEAILLPSRDAIDCFDMLEGRAPVVPKRLRMRRVDLAGRLLTDATLAPSDPDQVFRGLIAAFYDANEVPHFIVGADDQVGATGCDLLAWEKGRLVTVAKAPDLAVNDCFEPRIWRQRTGRSLKDSLGRPESPEAAIPSSPQKLTVVVR